MPEKIFMAGVSSVLPGVVVAQIISLSGMVYLSRFFSPAFYGQYFFWLAIVTFMSIVISGRFETALTNEPDGSCRSCAAMATLKTIGISAIIFIFIFTVLYFGKLKALSSLSFYMVLLIIPAAGLLAGCQTLQNLAAADGRLKDLSRLRIYQAVSIVVFQVFFSFLSKEPFILANGHLIGILISFIFGLHFSQINKKTYFDCDSRKLINFWKRHYRFPLYSLPADSLNSATVQLPVIIVTSRFGAESGALLAMALRTVGSYVSLISFSVLDVFKRSASLAYRERGESRAEYIRSFTLLSCAAVLMSISILIFAKPIFDHLFGNNWQKAGLMCQLLLPKLMLGLIVSPLSFMFYVADKQDLDFLGQSGLLAITFLAFLFPKTLQISLLCYSFGFGFIYLGYLWLSFRYACGKVKW